uniref:Uncharacterized protein n=1 Tax=Saccharum spontaneum TaxID=62335 RepID=A0A678TQ22_SACSP|nr:hypothetical protein SS47J13_000006 [Saccharum spontaneum]
MAAMLAHFMFGENLYIGRAGRCSGAVRSRGWGSAPARQREARPGRFGVVEGGAPAPWKKGAGEKGREQGSRAGENGRCGGGRRRANPTPATGPTSELASFAPQASGPAARPRGRACRVAPPGMASGPAPCGECGTTAAAAAGTGTGGHGVLFYLRARHRDSSGNGNPLNLHPRGRPPRVRRCRAPRSRSGPPFPFVDRSSGPGLLLGALSKEWRRSPE